MDRIPYGTIDEETGRANAAFIAACSEDVPDLVREVRRCWERIGEMEEALAEAEKEAAIRREAFIFQTKRLVETEGKHEL